MAKPQKLLKSDRNNGGPERVVTPVSHEDVEEGDVVRGCERGARHACMEEAVVAAAQRKLLVFRVC
ncbi:CTP synthase [Gossypium arboreum]|uniref:CTP synthase n=1 Tax=Gossypium arboreum TaxID=29729 RepID=A0A0B0MH95_GOSAR|nr:CTP synthase [Gossypium arboreum]